MTQDHDSPACASLGHYVAHVTMAWCPHLSAWSMHVHAGDEQDDTSWRMQTVRFGPFDSDTEVEHHAIRELQRLLRTDRAAWVAMRRERRGRAAPTTEG